MKRQPQASPAIVSRWAGVIAISVLSAPILEAGETNNAPPATLAPSVRIPDLDDVTVKGVRVSPARFNPTDAGGQGTVSFDAPGSTFSANGSLPSGGTSSNKREFVAAPIPFFSTSIRFGIGLGAAYIYNPPFAGTNAPPWITGGARFILAKQNNVSLRFDAARGRTGNRPQIPCRGEVSISRADFLP